MVGVAADRWERLIVAVLSILGVTFLGYTGHLEEQTVATIYATVLGYMLGHAAGATAERRNGGTH